ncbi:MAG: peroxidase [Candidatus Methanoperedenaceae archaeon]|nr:MAG: peroxidase [Candidatus Methanoperedenaceae archaeon]
MTRIKPIEKEDASDDVRIIYKEIEAGFGMVPNLFKTYAHFPALLRVNWDKTKALMMGGELSRELKESIAVVVSSANSCNYCVAATLTPHKITDSETTELRSLGLTDSQIVEILGVMELFTGYNKFLDAVEIDFPEV